MARLDDRIGWSMLAASNPVATQTGVLVELDSAIADGMTAISRGTLTSVINALADAGVARLYIDAAFNVMRQSDDTTRLAAALARFGPDRVGVARPPAWQRSGMLVVPELAPHVSVLEADQPVDFDGWVSRVGAGQDMPTGLPVAPRWLVGQPATAAATVHPAARTDGLRRMNASTLLAAPGSAHGLAGAWVVLAYGPDLPGQRSQLRSQGALTRGQTVALAAATIESGREPRQTLPLAAAIICALVAAIVGWAARLRLPVAGSVFGSVTTGTATLAVAGADIGTMMVPLASVLTGATLAFLTGRVLVEPRCLQLRAWLLASVGSPLPGWRAYTSDLDAVVLVARNGTILAANATARSLLPGLSASGTTIATILDPGIAEEALAAIDGSAGQAVASLNDGSLWVEATITPVPGDAAIACAITLRDVTALQAASRQLARLVETDPLTGLLNRLGLADRFRQAATGLTVLLIDLDGFKPVNDRHGHAAGDAVLRAIGARLGGIGGLTVARIGGDEFVVLADSAGAAPAHLAAAVEALVSQPVRHGGLSLQVGASIGWAVSALPHRPLDDILDEADRAMYRVKETRPAHRRRDPADSRAA
jgi:diguanylate cyclase (GGDEF)-like protein